MMEEEKREAAIVSLPDELADWKIGCDDLAKREKFFALAISAIGRICIGLYALDLAASGYREIIAEEELTAVLPPAGTIDEFQKILAASYFGGSAKTKKNIAAFFDMKTLPERLAGAKYICHEDLTGDGRWVRLIVLTGGGRKEAAAPAPAICFLYSIDEEKKQAIGYVRQIRRANAQIAADLAAQRRQLAIISAFSHNFFYTAYIDLKTGTFEEISGIDYISDRLGKQGPAKKALADYIEIAVEIDFQAEMTEFTALATLATRLKDTSVISLEYISYFLGWCRAQFFVASRDKKGMATSVVYAVRSISGEKKQEEALLQKIKNYDRQIYIDPLTGLYNRHYFEENMAKLADFFAVAMLDVDDYSDIIGTHGPYIGELILREVAKTMTQGTRKGDIVIRQGEDAFAVAFAAGPAEDIEHRLEDIRAAVERFSLPECPAVKVTISIGCAIRTASANIFMTADKLLYKAKQKKNCLEM